MQIRGWPPTQRGLAGFVVTMALGGYVVFMAVIVLYYLALGGETFRFIRDALTGGAWLGFGVAVPALLARKIGGPVMIGTGSFVGLLSGGDTSAILLKMICCRLSSRAFGRAGL